MILVLGYLVIQRLFDRHLSSLSRIRLFLFFYLLLLQYYPYNLLYKATLVKAILEHASSIATNTSPPKIFPSLKDFIKVTTKEPFSVVALGKNMRFSPLELQIEKSVLA